jgi:hypothetical protein
MIYMSLGDWCGPRKSFRLLFNLKSFPFDNIRTPNFKSIIYLVENNFKDFLECDKKVEGKKKIFKNKILDIEFPHDNLDDISEINKYQRRIDRFYEYLLNDEIICFVRTYPKSNVFNFEEKNMNKFCNLILEKNPKKKFCILIYNKESLINFGNTFPTSFSKLVNILHDIKFDNKKNTEYKLKLYNINLEEIQKKIEIKNIDNLIQKEINYYIQQKITKPYKRKTWNKIIKNLKNFKKLVNKLYN